MTKGITVKSKVHFGRGRESKKVLRRGQEPVKVQARVPRISRLMALAIKFDQMIRDGVVADYAELARLGYVTRARMTQVMDLLNLAPSIQEALLSLGAIDGKDPITEREMRALVAEVNWTKQRTLWSAEWYRHNRHDGRQSSASHRSGELCGECSCLESAFERRP